MIDTELIVDLKVTVPLRVTDFDRYGRLKPSAVLALFQEAATVQANVMDIGHDAMERRGVFWAVIRTSTKSFVSLNSTRACKFARGPTRPRDSRSSVITS